ncbi:MAG TPA: 16S rRNA (cytosine(967)-C(5))-methyltransferase RsmB [Longimicrobiales bacterium]|nr:16S rRNA (cytosine(967)-C(5))-methyltransferase RsmB [Longimicrobiales bacterium]
MVTVTPARVTALQIMRAIRSGELADRAFVRLVTEVSARERAWLHELVYGTLRLRGRIDYILGQFVKRGVAKLDADVHDILRLGVYQLLEMHSVPAYAAISQMVELTKKSGVKSASGFVNGVLQSLQRGRDKLERDAEEWTSHPRWLLERWRREFGWEETLRLTAANNARPELYIRPIGITAADAARILAEQGIDAQTLPSAPDALHIASDSAVTAVLEAVPAIVQDPAAGLVTRYADLNGVVADICAAPGGKAIAIAAQLESGAVVASDISAQRMQRLSENVARLPGLPLHVVVADGRCPVVKSCDGVLLDAPCTGTGTFKRHPDGKWRIQPHDLKALATLQRSLLDAAAAIVKPGGVLVYSTCSLEPEENVLQIENFLERQNGAFALAAPSSWHDETQLTPDGLLLMLPQRHGFDGAFAARMVRV